MKQFRDRVAVVTGAASGIGLALAERFAAEGMKVVMADIELDALAKAADAVRQKAPAGPPGSTSPAPRKSSGWRARPTTRSAPPTCSATTPASP
jgi:NAD(P)-dependent dehydrogenase (short-subunit alcohol dehydrogenase family)